MNRRHLILGAVFALTLAASVMDLPWQQGSEPQGPADTAVASVRNAVGVPPARPASAPAAAPAAPRAVRMHHTPANAFAAHSWLPPVAKAKPAPPAQPPQAPPLPFVYLGKMQEGAVTTVFVSQGGRNHVLHSGDSLAGYRVESISSTDITFVYLALGERQRFPFGSEN